MALGWVARWVWAVWAKEGRGAVVSARYEQRSDLRCETLGFSRLARTVADDAHAHINTERVAAAVAGARTRGERSSPYRQANAAEAKQGKECRMWGV